MPLVYCRIRTILHIYPWQPVPKTDCQFSRRSILDSLGLQRVFWWPVQFFPGVCQIWFHCGKDWYLFTCFFIPTMWLKKTFHSVFSKFEIVRQINAFSKPDLFFCHKGIKFPRLKFLHINCSCGNKYYFGILLQFILFLLLSVNGYKMSMSCFIIL